MSDIYRKTYVEVNLSNIYENYQYVQQLNNSITIIPVVKANAYGHGAIEVVRYLVEKGLTMFAVSLLEEALELHEQFPEIEILIMGVLDMKGFKESAEKNFIVTCSNFDQVDELSSIQRNIKIHLKVDTGMSRLGFRSEEDAQKAIELLSNNQYCMLQGIYTHFSTADEDEQYYRSQKRKFEQIMQGLQFDFKMVHISNSASSIKYEQGIDYTSHARLGISLYGLSLDKNLLELKNTFMLKTKVSEINHLPKGSKVGYGATYTASKDEIIGILPLGYADGFIRKNQGGFVEINHKRYEIIGRICMDQTFIRIDEKVTKDDDVIVFGGMITIDEVASRLETINYEVICQITSRVPKIYVK